MSAQWDKPDAYMRRSRLAPGVEMMTPKDGSGLPKETISMPIGYEAWKWLMSQDPLAKRKD